MKTSAQSALPGTGRDSFSTSYSQACARVRGAAAAVDAQQTRFTLDERGPCGEALCMDAIRIGAPDARRVVVVSSGVHGVEGFLGSAVQHRLLNQVAPDLGWSEDPAVVILHAVNPYGFAWLRRVNENNVDLNRNFPTTGHAYEGCPEAYRQVDELLNPTSAPCWDFFYPRVAEKVVRHGYRSLKEAVLGGQYECPRGLFYGGRGPNAAVQLLDRALPSLIGPAEQVLHLDIHSGLGKWGEYKLLLDAEEAPSNSEGWKRFSGAFQPGRLAAVNHQGDRHPVSGSFGQWCRERFPDRVYDVVCAEFGTYAPLKVLTALREENRAHHYGEAGSQSTLQAKRELKEVFAPMHPGWRDTTVAEGVAIVERAIDALRAPTLH